MGRRLGAAAVVVGVAACNAITGVNDLVEGRNPLARKDGGLSPDGAPWGIGPEAGIDTSIPPASLAKCGEGRICLPATSGWTAVAHPSNPGACPEGWPTRTDLVEATGGACSCTCQASGVSCVGALVVQLNGSCNGGDQSVDPGNGDGSCGADSPIPIPAPPSISGHFGRAS